MVGYLNFELPYNQKIWDNGFKVMDQISKEAYNVKVAEVEAWGLLSIQIGKSACAPLGILLP